MAQQLPHVPKFGDFESDNDVPYTAYFENARNNKGSGIRINPNDPEENPEAFMLARKGNGLINDSFSPISARGSSGKSIPVEKQQKYHRRNDSRSVASESGSDKSNPDNFLNRNRGNNNRKKSMAEYDNFVPPSLEPDRHRVSDVSCTSASLPKFGAWDKKDLASGEGFTVIFNKVKEEKQIAASKFPAVAPQVATHTKARNKKKNKSKSKIRMEKWCCLFPREKHY